MCRERRVLCFPTVLVHEEVLPPPAAPAALRPYLHRAWSRHSRWLHVPGPGTNALTPGGVSNRNLFSLSSGGRSCKIEAWGAWFPLRLRRAPVPGLPPRLLVVCCASLGFLRVTPGFPAHGVLSVRPAVVMERGSPFAVMWDLLQCDLILTDGTGDGPVSRRARAVRQWWRGRNSTHDFSPRATCRLTHPFSGRGVPPAGPRGSSGPALLCFFMPRGPGSHPSVRAWRRAFGEAGRGAVFPNVPCRHFPEVPLPLALRVKEQKPPLFSGPVHFRGFAIS